MIKQKNKKAIKRIINTLFGLIVFLRIIETNRNDKFIKLRFNDNVFIAY